MPRPRDQYVDLTPEERKELLPCPWCGEPDYENMDNENYLVKVIFKFGWYSVRCHGCSTTRYSGSQTWEEAIQRWNNRAIFTETNQYFAGIQAARKEMQEYLKGLSILDGHID